MAVTLDDLAAHLGLPALPADTEPLDRCLNASRAILRPHLVTTDVSNPEAVATLDLATLMVAADLWRRKDANGGQYLFADGSDYPAYLPRDVLATVWPMLQSAGLVGIVTA